MKDSCRTLSEVTAVILIGGLGTRLRSVVPDRPKVLAEVQGRPFLAFLLDQLTETSIKRVALCTGYKGEQVQAVFGHSYGPLDLFYSPETSPLGTGGALRLALHLIESDPVLVMNGDSYCGANLNAFWMWHTERDAAGSILLTQTFQMKRFGRVQVDSDGLVLDFDEKGERGGQGWINAGVYLLGQDFILSIPENRTVSLEREIFPMWVGRKLYGYESAGRFLDIGTPEDYAAAGQFFSILKKGSREERAFSL